MTTITINTYDAAGRFDMDAAEAKAFFAYVAAKASEAGFDVDYAEDLAVDETSENFISACFDAY